MVMPSDMKIIAVGEQGIQTTNYIAEKILVNGMMLHTINEYAIHHGRIGGLISRVKTLSVYNKYCGTNKENRIENTVVDIMYGEEGMFKITLDVTHSDLVFVVADDTEFACNDIANYITSFIPRRTLVIFLVNSEKHYREFAIKIRPDFLNIVAKKTFIKQKMPTLFSNVALSIISSIIYSDNVPGLITLGIGDLKTVVEESDEIFLGIGNSTDKEHEDVIVATKAALKVLKKQIDMKDMKQTGNNPLAVVYVTVSRRNMSMLHIDEALNLVKEHLRSCTDPGYAVSVVEDMAGVQVVIVVGVRPCSIRCDNQDRWG